MSTAPHVPSPIDTDRSRSWLLLTAARPDDFDAAAASSADQLILDLEDGVDPSRRRVAREAVRRWLSSGHGAWVRINERESPDWNLDLDALQGLDSLLGVMLAKAETSAQVAETFVALGRRMPVIALIETAVGLENAGDIARAEGVVRLAFGSGDYRHDTGADATDGAMAYPRSRLVVASRASRLPGPIDGPTVGGSRAHLREGCEVASSHGMTGKLCLKHEDGAVINEALSPSATDIDWARQFLHDFDRDGGTVRDGSDPPRLRRARKILDLASDFGLSTPVVLRPGVDAPSTLTAGY
jgi:citrate lyase subunit beta/citryl-CoA lyase